MLPDLIAATSCPINKYSVNIAASNKFSNVLFEIALGSVTSENSDFVVNVQSFGAKGDGITDDTTAIQNAINTAKSGSIIYFPRTSKYYLCKTITLKSNLIIDGTGEISLKPGTNDSLFVIPKIAENVIIKNIRMVGTNNTFPYSKGLLTVLAASKNNNCKIQNCTVVDGSIVLERSSYIKISNNTLFDSSISLITSCHHNTIFNNFIYTPSNNINGIDITDTEGGGTNNIAENNTIFSSRMGIEVYENSNYTTLSSNTIYLFGNSPESFGISLAGVNNCLIKDNTISRADDTLTSPYGIELASANNTKVFGNTIRNVDIGIIINGSDKDHICYGNLVSNNLIERVKTVGIDVFRYTNDNIINDNRITMTESNSKGIFVEGIEGNTKNIIISKNIINAMQSSDLSCLVGIWVLSLEDSSITDNNINHHGNGTTDINSGLVLSYGSKLIVRGNRINGSNKEAYSGITSNGGDFPPDSIICDNILSNFKRGFSALGRDYYFYNNIVSGDALSNELDMPILISNINGNRLCYGNSIPKQFYWKKGDIIYNSNPSPNQYIGWVCTVSGTSGEWKGFGLIQK